MIKSLEAVNIVLLNIYFIMTLQLALNWQPANCNTGSNFFQLAFILIMLLRIAVQEAHNNQLVSSKVHKALMLVSSGALLNALGIY